MKNNKRKSIRKKIIREERNEKARQDQLYEESRIDPETIYGQSILPITDLVPKKYPKSKENFIKKFLKKLF